MKKISSKIASNYKYINRPFALRQHEHDEYVRLDSNTLNEKIDPQFTYQSGNLTRIDYKYGDFKVFYYTDGNLTSVEYTDLDASLHVKTLVYNIDGTLQYIVNT